MATCANAAHARYLDVRRLLLIGRLDEAERKLAALDPDAACRRRSSAAARAGRRGHRHAAAAGEGGARCARSRAAAPRAQAGIPALSAEVESAARDSRRAGRAPDRARRGAPLLLDDVEALLASEALVIDACRNAVRERGTVVAAGHAAPCCSRWPVRWPKPGQSDVSRATLLARAFGAKFADDSHRARLRVEIGRLRRPCCGRSPM